MGVGGLEHLQKGRRVYEGEGEGVYPVLSTLYFVFITFNYEQDLQNSSKQIKCIRMTHNFTVSQKILDNSNSNKIRFT